MPRPGGVENSRDAVEALEYLGFSSVSAIPPPIDTASPAAAALLARRAGLLLLAVGAAYAVLVATHRGEFWPFSVYPMFSRAGRPWARACVLTWTPPIELASLRGGRPLESWPGTPFPLREHGLSQNDLSSLVQRAEQWTPEDRLAIEHAFGSLPCAQPLVLMRVAGTLDGQGVRQEATPVAWLRCEDARTRVQPLLTATREASPSP
jgi:hypothetical protein